MIKKSTWLTVWRVFLVCLIVANLFMIFSFSLQNSKASSDTSLAVTKAVANATVEGYKQMNYEEKTEVYLDIDGIIRKCAHMAEFGLLGMLTFLLLLTWRKYILPKYGISLSAVFLTACLDELTQKFVEGRSAQFKDVLIDFTGAIISCTLLLGITLLIYRHRAKKRMNREEFI